MISGLIEPIKLEHHPKTIPMRRIHLFLGTILSDIVVSPNLGLSSAVQSGTNCTRFLLACGIFSQQSYASKGKTAVIHTLPTQRQFVSQFKPSTNRRQFSRLQIVDISGVRNLRTAQEVTRPLSLYLRIELSPIYNAHSRLVRAFSDVTHNLYRRDRKKEKRRVFRPPSPFCFYFNPHAHKSVTNTMR